MRPRINFQAFHQTGKFQTCEKDLAFRTRTQSFRPLRANLKFSCLMPGLKGAFIKTEIIAYN